MLILYILLCAALLAVLAALTVKLYFREKRAHLRALLEADTNMKGEKEDDGMA